jgi:hypothetical protein
VTVSTWDLGAGETSPGKTATGTTVPVTGGEVVLGLGFVRRVGATYLTADAAAAALRAKFSPRGFLDRSKPLSTADAGVAVMLGSLGKIGSRGARFGL